MAQLSPQGLEARVRTMRDMEAVQDLMSDNALERLDPEGDFSALEGELWSALGRKILLWDSLVQDRISSNIVSLIFYRAKVLEPLKRQVSASGLSQAYLTFLEGTAAFIEARMNTIFLEQGTINPDRDNTESILQAQSARENLQSAFSAMSTQGRVERGVLLAFGVELGRLDRLIGILEGN
jgi:hypothetical protein